MLNHACVLCLSTSFVAGRRGGTTSVSSASPVLPGAGADAFPGRQMHSHNYREAGPFAGQRVVVVGAAASGEDIGREISETATEVRF